MRALLRWLILLTGGAMTGGLLFLIAVDQIVMPRLVDAPRITVPRLRGKTVAEARSSLARWGLSLSVGDSLYHDSLPAGTVVDHEPPPGARIKKGRRIAVDVSLGRRHYAVPDGIVGVSLREARLQLEAQQLRLGEITFVSSAQLPRGTVISATPAAGTLLPRGTLVDLEISNGDPDEPKQVPELRQLPIEQVEDTLRKYEMRLGTITTRLAPQQPSGTVLEQDPPAGSRARRLSPIELTISAHDTTATAAPRGLR